MFRAVGIDIALKQSDRAPGRWDVDWESSGPNKGNPRFGDERHHAVLTLLLAWKRGRRLGTKIYEGGYYFDTKGTRGTLIWTVQYDLLATASQLKAYAEDAGQQAIARGIIAKLTAEARRLSPGRWRLDVAWVLPGPDAQRAGAEIRT